VVYSNVRFRSLAKLTRELPGKACSTFTPTILEGSESIPSHFSSFIDSSSVLYGRKVALVLHFSPLLTKLFFFSPRGRHFVYFDVI
jgi:hypothetical protein